MQDAEVADPVPVEVVYGPDVYLLGQETGLLEAVEGRLPLPRSHRPYMEGLFAAPPKENPTLVNNAETLASVPHILREGPGWLRSTGPSGHRARCCSRWPATWSGMGCSSFAWARRFARSSRASEVVSSVVGR